MDGTMQAPGRPGPGGWIPKSRDLVPRARWRNLTNGEILSNRAGSRDLRRPDAKPTLVDLQRADLRLESRSRDPEPCALSCVAKAPDNPCRPSTWGLADSQLSSTVNSSVSETITDRSITFCSSRTFPGH